MTDTLDPFASPTEVSSTAPKVFGERGPNGRYHMPLLPGEKGVKAGGNWVPKGIQSVTNLVGAYEDTRALNVWEQAMALIGLALSSELYEELAILVNKAKLDGVNWEVLREHPELRTALAGLPDRAGNSIIGRAKRVAKAEAAAQRGTNRHTVWEHRGKTGQLIGTDQINGQLQGLESLLAAAGLERVPGLSERVVRNLVVNTAGRFDDILREVTTGRYLMSDLKTKSTPFYSWQTTDAQLATYANSEWMLTEDCQGYTEGPKHHVDLTEGVVLHVPSDGKSPARLERADLIEGWKAAQLARAVVTQRAAGKSVWRHDRSEWTPR